MTPLSRRPLTPGEQALAAEMFGEALDSARIRIFALPVWRRAFVAGPRWIIWPARSVRSDFSAAGVALRVQAMFVHELVHVWQAQCGVGLLRAKLRAGDGPAAYAYDLELSAFDALNIEQQAMVVEHAFLASRGACHPHDPALYARAEQAWRAA